MKMRMSSNDSTFVYFNYFSWRKILSFGFTQVVATVENLWSSAVTISIRYFHKFLSFFKTETVMETVTG